MPGLNLASPWEELEALLSGEPSEILFQAICRLLDSWPGSRETDARALAEERLETWPDRVRLAPWPRVAALLSGETTPSWNLVRALRNFHPGRNSCSIPLHRLGPRPEWLRIRRVELHGDTAEDLSWLAIEEAQWPRLQSLKATFPHLPQTTAHVLAGSPLMARLRTLSLDDLSGSGNFPALEKTTRLDRLALRAPWAVIARLLHTERLPHLFTLKWMRSPGETSNTTAEIARVASADVLARFRVLELENPTETEVETLLRAPALNRLRALKIRFEAQRTAPMSVAEALIGRPFLAPLRQLALEGCPLGDPGLVRLREALKYTRLEHLELPGANLGDQAAFLLADCAGLLRLRTLDLSGSGIGSLGAGALAGSPYLNALETMRLSGPVGDSGMIVLAGKNQLTNLKSLHLEKAEITGRGLAALAASRWLGQMKSLHLAGNDLGGHLHHLAHAPLLPRLQGLDLSQCRLRPVDLVQLRDMPLSQLRTLRLANNPEARPGLRLLAMAPWFSSLWHLDLTEEEPCSPHAI